MYVCEKGLAFLISHLTRQRHFSGPLFIVRGLECSLNLAERECTLIIKSHGPPFATGMLSQSISGLPFSIYMIFIIDTIRAVSFPIHVMFTKAAQSPFFNLQDINFTWFFLDLQNIYNIRDGLPFRV